MTNVFCVRAEFGLYTKHFVNGGYVAIGGIQDTDLSTVAVREELYPLYKAAHPEDTSNVVIGQAVGQLARFLVEMRVDDYVITPAADTEWLHYGKLTGNPSYNHAAGDDGCPYRHRRRVDWAKDRLRRGDLSVPFQNTIRSSLTVFAVSQKDEFFTAIGQAGLVGTPPATAYDAHRVVLDQVLQLDDKEFEVLITHLLAALGFESTEHTGKTGDGGVDATGELNVANLAKVKVFVQAKRYKQGTRIPVSTVRQFRQAIPFGGQGAFITTADFQKSAKDVASEPGFPRIGLVHGRQLVDLLIKHWDDIPTEFRDRLGLRQGLVLV
ncbi:MAG: restriction endonuclease [Gemmatimonadaceae bacterium]